jgi:hypothetical protein
MTPPRNSAAIGSIVPEGTIQMDGTLYPAINGWAIFVTRHFRGAIIPDEK